MIRKINRWFFICLCGVIGLAVGTIIGPRYFSRMLDQTNLNMVSVVNRDSFSFLEQSSDQLADQVKLLNSIGNGGNLMLLSNYSDQKNWQNSTLIAQIVDQVALASIDGYIPWLEPGIYENYLMEIMKKQASKESPAFYDWMNELKFAKYYGLTCESDTDSHMMQMMNLWYLRFSDEQTFDYYFLVKMCIRDSHICHGGAGDELFHGSYCGSTYGRLSRDCAGAHACVSENIWIF